MTEPVPTGIVSPTADTLLDLAYEAWVVIANVSEGDWSEQGREWVAAAVRWRDRFHAVLDAAGAARPPVDDTEDAPSAALAWLATEDTNLDAAIASHAARQDWVAADSIGEALRPAYPGGVYPWSAFQSRGLLWLVNAAAFHPRGYALAFIYPEGADRAAVEAGHVEPIGWDVIGDGTERWSFAENEEMTPLLDARFLSVSQVFAAATERDRVERAAAKLSGETGGIATVTDDAFVGVAYPEADGEGPDLVGP